MDIAKELDEAKQRRQNLIDRINQIDQDKQMLLQALLREDGKIEILDKLLKEEST